MTQRGDQLALFTTPKPFRGHMAVIQRNAIRSWHRLQPPAQILVFGGAEGAAGAAAQLGVRHTPGVGRNEYGTPLVSAMFAEAERLSHSPLMCYVNADIILMSDFTAAVRRVGARVKGPGQDPADLLRSPVYGRFDERLVEYPFVRARTTRGRRVLDGGCTILFEPVDKYRLVIEKDHKS